MKRTVDEKLKYNREQKNAVFLRLRLGRAGLPPLSESEC